MVYIDDQISTSVSDQVFVVQEPSVSTCRVRTSVAAPMERYQNRTLEPNAYLSCDALSTMIVQEIQFATRPRNVFVLNPTLERIADVRLVTVIY